MTKYKKMKNKLLITVFLFIGLLAKAQSLKDYLEIAGENNPELQSIQYQYESSLEKVNEVGSLPNTTIGVGYFVQPVETRVGAQKAKIIATQSLPWFGALGAKKESATYKSEAELNNYDFAKRRLFLKIRTTYFELYELNKSVVILQKNIDILKTYEKLALNELENNRSTMVDILKIRMEKNELENNIHSVRENLKSTQSAFNLLLNRDEHMAVIIVDEVLVNNSLLFNKESISDNPKLLQLDNLQSSIEKSEVASKKDGLPTFGIGLEYGFVQSRDIENLQDNGRDIVMPMVSVSFPLFSKKYSSQQKQLKLEQKVIESSKVTTLNQLNTVYETALSKLENSKVSISTQEENIHEAERAKNVLLSAYETSKVDFEQLLEIQQLQLKFQLKKVISEKQYAIQKATLQFLTNENSHEKI